MPSNKRLESMPEFFTKVRQDALRSRGNTHQSHTPTAHDVVRTSAAQPHVTLKRLDLLFYAFTPRLPGCRARAFSFRHHLRISEAVARGPGATASEMRRWCRK